MKAFTTVTQCAVQTMAAVFKLTSCGEHAVSYLRWLNTILAVSDYMSFAKSWQEKGSSQAETWRVKNILMKDFD